MAPGQPVFDDLSRFSGAEWERGPLRTQLFQFRVVESLQKLPRRSGFGRSIAKSPLQTGVMGQQADVLGAFPAQRLEQTKGLDHLVFGKVALALAQGKVGGDQVGQPQGTIDAGKGEQAGVTAGSLSQSAANAGSP